MTKRPVWEARGLKLIDWHLYISTGVAYGRRGGENRAVGVARGGVRSAWSTWDPEFRWLGLPQHGDLLLLPPDSAVSHA